MDGFGSGGWPGEDGGKTTDELPALDARKLKREGLIDPGQERVEGAARLEWTPCNFGGSRPWFVGPGRGRRAAILHEEGSGALRCRLCLGACLSEPERGPDRPGQEARREGPRATGAGRRQAQGDAPRYFSRAHPRLPRGYGGDRCSDPGASGPAAALAARPAREVAEEEGYPPGLTRLPHMSWTAPCSPPPPVCRLMNASTGARRISRATSSSGEGPPLPRLLLSLFSIFLPLVMTGMVAMLRARRYPVMAGG